MDIITRAEAQQQGLKQYFTGTPCKYGHVDTRFTCNGKCRTCANQDPKRAERRKAFLERNPGYQSKYYVPCADLSEEDRARKRERNRRYASSPVGRACRQAYKKANPEKFAVYQARSRAKRSSTPELAIAHRLRSRVQTAMKHHQGVKGRKTEQLVGCAWQDLRRHLETQFVDGMNWENMGEWHIDHIRPCAGFDLTDLEQQKACFHWSNLQPLWAADNQSKGAKLVA